MTLAAPIWLCPDQVFDGRSLLGGRALLVADGLVMAVEPVASLPPSARRRAIPGVLTPGYVDLQVNGGGDVLLNNAPSAAGIAAIASAHRRLGTAAILPTVITDAPETLARAGEAAIAAKGGPGQIGLHIEGPHIAAARRGAHDAEFIRPMDARTLALVERLRAEGLAVMITVAPEAVGPGDIARLAATGAVVSLGHSDATAGAVQAGLAEGARAFTHLYNAMSPMLGRAPGVTGAAINSTAYCGFICDGHHVADEMLALAIRARPVPDRMFLISDAMATVGGSDHYTLYGQEIRLREGRLVTADGTLAGAHVTMAEGVARLIRVLGIAPEAALRMALTVPAELIGRPDLGRPLGRPVADLILLGPDWMPQAIGSGLLTFGA